VQPFTPLLEQIEQAREADLYPFYSSVDPQAAVNGGGRPVVLVANDYLGLAGDRRVCEAAREAITKFGTSRCSSPLAGGHSQLHGELQARIASFLHQEAAALFASGYQANVGIVSSLMQRDDLIVTDLFNHASIVDGARLSGAEVRFFQHNSASHLDKVLAQEAKGRRILVVVEGIYSADGDIVRLPELCEVAHSHGALLMIDEAHSLGVLGKGGRGAAEHFDLLGEVDLIMGTMSKSLASVGGFVAADRCIVDAVAHSARALIFSAALPPAGAAAALTALQIIESEPQRRERLWDNAQFLLDGLQRLGFDTMNSVTPVIPIRVGDPGKTIEFAARLRSAGVLVCPAIPPMVQSHLSRVRAHVTAAHDHASLGHALRAIEEVGAAIGIRRVSRSAPVRRSGSRPRAKTRHTAELQRA
jgi:8-amino-7-oxononanoate synthase